MGAPSPASAGLVPFREQGEYFARKVNVPTLSWTDLVHGQHAPAFVVAGAARDDLLGDLRAAVDKVIDEGQTLEGFRKEFDAVVGKYGWAYNGGRNWRTRVIYETNLRSSYQVGRYKQLMAISHLRPYWVYRHNDAAVVRPRPIHQSWSGTTLQWDSPWWSTHYPPNGWGCKCYIDSASERELQRMGKSGPDTPPPLDMQEVTIGTRGPNPKVVRVPKGIDPGWGYNPGEAAWGRGTAQARVRQQSAGTWTELPAPGPAEAGRPPRLPTPAAPTEPLQPIVADTAILQDPIGDSVLVDRVALPEIEDGARVRQALVEPQELWVNWLQQDGGPAVALRKYIRSGPDGLTAVHVVGGVVTGIRTAASDDERRGQLLYAEPTE